MPGYITKDPVYYMYANMDLEDGDFFQSIPIDYVCLKEGQSPLSPRQIYQINKNKNCPEAPYEFAYAYAITTWKAQGSEWDKVLGFEEGFPFDAETHRKFLYTMVTRAKEKLVLITKN
jgi:hypothetical protein